MIYGETTTLYKLIDNSDSPLILMPGGTGSGKTIAVIMYLISIAQTADDPILIQIMTDTAPTLRDGALRDFQNILRANNLWPQFAENRTDKIYTNKATQAQIQFVALDDPLKARGGRRDYLYVNEANRIKYETFDQLHVRTSTQTVLDWNPSSKFWAYDHYIDNPKARGTYKTFTTTYKDNEGLPAQVIANIEAHDHHTNWWRVYGLGQVGELENNVYSGWRKLDNLPQSRELLAYGIDFGNSPDPTAMVAVWRAGEEIIFEQMFERANLLIDQQADMISSMVSARGDAIVYCDYGGGGAALIAELQHRGLMAVNADKRAGSVLSGIESVRNIPSVAYMGKDLEREYLAYQHKVKRGSGEILPTPQDGNDHLLDALRYAWYSFEAADNERRQSLERAKMYDEGQSDDDEVGAWIY